MDRDDYFGSFKEKAEHTAFMKEDIKTVRFDPALLNEDVKKSSSKGKEPVSQKKRGEVELSDDRKSQSQSSHKKFLKENDLTEIKKAIDEEAKDEKKKHKKAKVPPINEIENVLMRRFSVKIRDIKFHNLQKEYLTIFLQFIIGKDLKKEVFVTPLGRQTRYTQTTSGLRFKTELLKAVEHGELRNVSVTYENEYRASYDMLEEDSLTIQAWSYNRWRLNTFLGKYSSSLAAVANDSITKAISLKMVGQSKKVLGRVYFTGYFQEIWDWKLSFSEWKGFNFVDKSGTPLNSQLSLTLRTKEVREPTVRSSYVKRNANPSYEELKGSILFRGTLDEFENHFLSIKVWTNGKSVIKQVSLRGISQTLYLKSMIKLYDSKDIKADLSKRPVPSSSKQPIIDKREDTQGNEEVQDLNENRDENEDLFNRGSAGSEAEEDSDEEILQDDKNMIYITVEGRVNLNNMPRFKQKGELIRFKRNERYLIVLINRVEAVMAPDDRNKIDSFVSVNWGGNEKITQTFYDSNQPDFNEELVFRLPGKFQKNWDKVDSLKEELNSRSEVVFNLWIMNDDGSNESIGYVRFKLSELDKASREEKVYQEYYSGRMIKNMCRVSLITKSFVSAIDTPNTKIVAQVCFFPDIPDKIDLRTLKNDVGDRFPKAIHEIMNKDLTEGDYSKTEAYDRWDSMLKKNFERVPLEKNMAKIFLKFIFVKDQYGRQHFVSKYLGRYTIEELYPTDLANIEKEEKKAELKSDLRMKTYGEMAHFVRCIPFFEESRKTNDIWRSPDFLLTLKKGNIQDHCVLLANLFMGCEYENAEEVLPSGSKDKREKSLNQNRVFVCLGTVGFHKPEFHCWVMTIDKNFEVITFWETMRNEKFELRGRIQDTAKMEKFLYNSDKKQVDETFFKKLKNFGFEGLNLKNIANFSPIKNTIGKINNLVGSLKKVEENEEEDEQKEIYDEDPNRLNYKDDSVEVVEAIDIGELPNFFKTQSKRKQARYADSKKPKSDEKELKVPGFLDQRKREIAEDESKNKDEIKLQPVATFIDANDQKIKPVDLPYYSLEIVFNHKNAWANLQNQNPAMIYYNLYNNDEWGPYIVKDGETWRDDVGVFYEAKGFTQAMSFEECGKKMGHIIQELQLEISKYRSGANLESKWKHKTDKTNRHLEQLVKLIEYRDTRRFNRQTFDEKYADWVKEMKKLLPTDYRFLGLPMFFNYSEPEKIRSLVIENAESFYLRKEKIMYLGVAGRIFPYPNRFCSVRLILAIYYKMTDEIEEIEVEEENPLEALNKQLEEEQKKEEKIQKESGGYSPVPNQENRDNPEAPNNMLVEDGGLIEPGEDLELE